MISGRSYYGYALEPVKGDGNCLFRCLSLAFFGTQERHLDLRAELAEKIENYISAGRQEELFPLGNTYITDGSGENLKSVTPQEYVSRLKINAVWSEEQDIVLAQKLLCAPRSVGLIVVRDADSGITLSRALEIDMRAYDFYAYFVCKHDIHYDLLDVAGKKNTTYPRMIAWCGAPNLY